VPGGLPASLLERRPDIREAEQNLIAANANIGVAKAAYFPDISLTGLLGLESAQLSDLFKGPSKTWSVGAGLVQPIFNAGRIGAQVAQAEALQRQALYTYQKVDHQRFQDVENALIDRTGRPDSRKSGEGRRARNASAIWPRCATGKGRPSTWRLPTPSNRCSTRSCCTSRRSPNCSVVRKFVQGDGRGLGRETEQLAGSRPAGGEPRRSAE
jgi:hypothetical protein